MRHSGTAPVVTWKIWSRSGSPRFYQMTAYRKMLAACRRKVQTGGILEVLSRQGRYWSYARLAFFVQIETTTLLASFVWTAICSIVDTKMLHLTISISTRRRCSSKFQSATGRRWTSRSPIEMKRPPSVDIISAAQQSLLLCRFKMKQA